MPEVSTILMAVIVIGAIAAFVYPRYRLNRAVEEPFNAEWRKVLRQNFPVFRRMPADLQLQLKNRIKQFIHEWYLLRWSSLGRLTTVLEYGTV